MSRATSSHRAYQHGVQDSKPPKGHFRAMCIDSLAPQLGCERVLVPMSNIQDSIQRQPDKAVSRLIYLEELKPLKGRPHPFGCLTQVLVFSPYPGAIVVLVFEPQPFVVRSAAWTSSTQRFDWRLASCGPASSALADGSST